MYQKVNFVQDFLFKIEMKVYILTGAVSIYVTEIIYIQVDIQLPMSS